MLMDAVAEDGLSVIISSHIVADMERFCGHLVILSAAQVQISDQIDHLLASHKLLIGPREAAQASTGTYTILTSEEAERQCTLLVQTHGPIENPAWEVRDVSLEEIILAYLSQSGRERTESARKKCRLPDNMARCFCSESKLPTLNWSFYNDYPGGQTTLESLAHQDNCWFFARIMALVQFWYWWRSQRQSLDLINYDGCR